MVSTPIFNISTFISSAHLPQVMTPFVWFTATGHLTNNTANFLKLGFSTVPTIITILKYSTIAIGLLLFFVAMVVNYRGHSNSTLRLRELKAPLASS